MIKSYVDYIGRYMRSDGLNGRPNPGEHHFVAVYLLPKLFGFNKLVPDYVNPDGTKKVLGDIVYLQDGLHFRGIEVKLGRIRLTANEFNTWVLCADSKKHPHVFIGLGTEGLVLQKWSRFRDSYLRLIGSPDLSKMAPVIKGKYGPQRDINALIKYLQVRKPSQSREVYPWSQFRNEAAALESEFASALRSAINL